VRTYRKSEKISFESQLVYDAAHFDARWGADYQKILDLVDFQTKMPTMIQRGFGQVMSNLIFHHSVPDNTPGILWSDAGGWLPLFGNRSLPMWILPLLTGNEAVATNQSRAWNHAVPNEDVLKLLRLVKLGVRTIRGLALRLNCDGELVRDLLAMATAAGFTSSRGRITPAGDDALKRLGNVSKVAAYDRSLYTPSSWCAL